MDLEVVGRHALLFDDDALAAFVNSGDALVEWNSLQIDRYDVRHLLSAPLPPRRRRNPQAPSHLSDSSLESELDKERYLDLPPPSDEPEGEEIGKLGDTGGYNAVAFSYGNADDSAEQKNADGGLECSGFHPHFPVPESLLQNLPPTEKIHQIIARTAMFVSKHGGQSEFILRVKQGDNPAFGFLMPDHHLHAYFRFLVDHHELLQSEVDGKTQSEEQMMKTNQSSGGGGALSLLGSVYGSGEDEDCVIDDAHELKSDALGKIVNVTSSRNSNDLEKTESSSNADEKGKDDIITKHPPTFNKEKAHILKKNPLIAVSKTGSMSSMSKKDDSCSGSISIEMSKEPLMLEPPSDVKRLIDKIVEFIMKNGKQFEATLREQDTGHGRFPFLLPSNKYHPYYLAVLQKAQESQVIAKNSVYGKDESAGRFLDKKTALSKDNDATSLGSVGSDFPCESDRKEKFKMIIGKSKKDVQDPPTKATEQEYGIGIDVTAAAAILQAATRGLRNPNLGIISSIAMNGNSHGHGSKVGQGSSFGNQPISQTDNVVRRTDEGGQCNSRDPVANAIAKPAVSETADEVDSPEVHLTREQKLKAERLKRAKMFVAMLKSGAEPSRNEPLHGLSVEPPESGASGAGAEVNLADKEIEASSAPIDVGILDKSENSGRKHFGDVQGERRSRRKYRLRSERHDEDDEDTDWEDTDQNHSKKKYRSHGSSREGKDEREKDEYREHKHSKHSKKRHRSRRSLHEDDNGDEHGKDKSHKRSRKKHRSRHPSHEHNDGEKDAEMSHRKDSGKKHSSHQSSQEVDEGDYEDKYQKRSRKKHRSHRSSHRNRGSEKHRKGDSSRDKESSPRPKYNISSDTEHRHHRRTVEDIKDCPSEKEELEEGEISSKVSDQSRGSAGGHVSRETSMDISSTFSGAASQPSEATEVSDDLRAKIRAMLMATR